MTPAITAVRMSGAAHRAALPLLVLGPSAGASAARLWTAASAGLTDHFDVLAWDLPGHGHNRTVPDEPFTMAELAAGVLAVVDDVQAHRDDSGTPFAYAGVSVGGAVGLQLLLDAPHRVSSAVLLGDLAESGDDLGTNDLTGGLNEIGAPVLAVAGTKDPGTTVERLRQVAVGVGRGALVELAGTSYLAPEEQPEEVAALVRRHVLGFDDVGSHEGDLSELWDRPGLDRRSRAVVSLTALVLASRPDDLAAHVREAVRIGLTHDEINEVVLQAAGYSGVADAEAALGVVRRVLDAPD